MGNAQQVVLITGASSGIGESLAREYAKRGARLILCARRKQRLDALSAEIVKSGGSAIAVECDVCKRADLDAAVAAGVKAFGRLDTVVANAGFGVYGMVEDLSEENFRRQFETNIFGVLHTVQASLGELKKTRGRIAIVGSVYSYLTMPYVAPYTMSKYAVRALGETLAFELGPSGITVTMIYPGVIGTEFRMVDNMGRAKPDSEEPFPSFFVMPSDKAARQIRRAVDCRRRTLTITFAGKVSQFVKNHLPWLYDFVIHHGRALVLKYVKKIEA